VADGCQLVEKGVDHGANRANDGVADLRQDGLSRVVDDLHQTGVHPYWWAAGGHVIGEDGRPHDYDQVMIIDLIGACPNTLVSRRRSS
jgi:hypothetical protein